MKFSESLRKKIMNVNVGRITNRFKARHRVNVLFFEDIIAEYLKLCDKLGYEKEIFEIGREYTSIAISNFLPPIMKKLPMTLLFNKIIKKIWINIGGLDDLNVERVADSITMRTENEAIVRIIGKNSFSAGATTGLFSALIGEQLECIEINQIDKSCKYVLKILNHDVGIERMRSKRQYMELNRFKSMYGFTLKGALRNKTLILSRNKIYFRGKLLSYFENTLYHLIGNKGVLLERVPEISYRFFDEIIEKSSTKEKKLRLLKMLLQVMGWGVLDIVVRDKKIIFKIKNPPYGLSEVDNWEFLAKSIQGYLWLLNKSYKISDIRHTHKRLLITYSR